MFRNGVVQSSNGSNGSKGSKSSKGSNEGAQDCFCNRVAPDGGQVFARGPEVKEVHADFVLLLSLCHSGSKLNGTFFILNFR